MIVHFNHDSAHIVGNSMGGFIAAQMARFNGEKCLSITLIDPDGIVSPEPSVMMKMLSEGNNPFFIHNDVEFLRFYSMAMARPPFVPGIVKSAISEQYQARRDELQKIFNDYNKLSEFLDDELVKINIPALVIWGAKDELIHVSSAKIWADKLNCVCHVWHDLGHMPMVEASERTAFATHAFLNQHKN